MRILSAFASVVLLASAACGGASQPAQTSPGNAPATFAEQVARGQKLYGEQCASCHGPGGEGSKGAPRVVGLKEGALSLDAPATSKYRKTKFKTVADVADFAIKAMPPTAPGS